MSTKMIVFNIMKLFMKLPLKLSSAAASGWLAACLPACAASRDLEVNAALLSPLTELGWHPMNREEKKELEGKNKSTSEASNQNYALQTPLIRRLHDFSSSRRKALR